MTTDPKARARQLADRIPGVCLAAELLAAGRKPAEHPHAPAKASGARREPIRPAEKLFPGT